MDANTLHKIIEPTCPIVGTRVGNSNTPSTWSFQPASNATAQQISAAQALLSTLTPNSQSPTVAATAVSDTTQQQFLAQIDSMTATGDTACALSLVVKALQSKGVL